MSLNTTWIFFCLWFLKQTWKSQSGSQLRGSQTWKRTPSPPSQTQQGERMDHAVLVRRPLSRRTKREMNVSSWKFLRTSSTMPSFCQGNVKRSGDATTVLQWCPSAVLNLWPVSCGDGHQSVFSLMSQKWGLSWWGGCSGSSVELVRIQAQGHRWTGQGLSWPAVPFPVVGWSRWGDMLSGIQSLRSVLVAFCCCGNGGTWDVRT